MERSRGSIGFEWDKEEDNGVGTGKGGKGNFIEESGRETVRGKRSGGSGGSGGRGKRVSE